MGVVISSGSGLLHYVRIRAPTFHPQYIAVELIRHLCHGLEMPRLELNLRLLSRYTLVARECQRALKSIADLTTVPARASGIRLRPLLFAKLPGELDELVVVAFDFGFVRAADEIAPYLVGGEPIERWVVERHVDARLEGFVEGTDTVGG